MFLPVLPVLPGRRNLIMSSGLGDRWEEARGTLRFSLSPLNQREEIDYVLEQLPEIVAELRLFYRR